MNIVRYYQQNRRNVHFIIVVIVILVIGIKSINGILETYYQDNKENDVTEEIYKNQLNINACISDDEIQEQKELIIDQFIRYCNAKEVEKAYALLSDNCKKELFPTIADFKQNYYEQHFSTLKLYQKEIFIKDTYQVKLYENALETGKLNKNTEDYYTIIEENNTVKLNISQYIGNEKIEKSIEEEGIKIEIEEKQIYKEYETYRIKVTNLTDYTILLDSKEKTNTIYLVEENQIQYPSLAYEIASHLFMVKPKATNTVSIKFNREYTKHQRNVSLIFEDIILDYEAYEEQEENENIERKQMVVSL